MLEGRLDVATVLRYDARGSGPEEASHGSGRYLADALDF